MKYAARTNRPIKTKTLIKATVKQQGGTPAEIAERLNLDRLVVKQQLLRLFKAGYVDNHTGGYYTAAGMPDDRPRRRGKAPVMQSEPQAVAPTPDATDDLASAIERVRAKVRPGMDRTDIDGLAISEFLKMAQEFCALRSDFDPGVCDDFRNAVLVTVNG